MFHLIQRPKQTRGADMLKNIITIFTFISFGFGSLPNVSDGGLFVIGFFEQDPKLHPGVNSDGVILFTVEL